MKKILVVMMMCLMSASVFASIILKMRTCTATYYLKVFNNAGVNYRTIVIINSASTCKLAMSQAKDMAKAELLPVQDDTVEGTEDAPVPIADTP